MRGRLWTAGVLLLGLLAQGVLALDCDPRRSDAMPCCRGGAASSGQMGDGSRDCCRISPVGPEGGRAAVSASPEAQGTLALPASTPVAAARARLVGCPVLPGRHDASPPGLLVLRL